MSQGSCVVLRVNNSWLKVFPMMGRDNDLAIRNKGNRGRISSVLSSVICVLRGLPLFFSRRPGTPLRVLCVMAFDTLHLIRKSKRLSDHEVQILAVLLEFGACAAIKCETISLSGGVPNQDISSPVSIEVCRHEISVSIGGAGNASGSAILQIRLRCA